VLLDHSQPERSGQVGPAGPVCRDKEPQRRETGVGSLDHAGQPVSELEQPLGAIALSPQLTSQLTNDAADASLVSVYRDCPGEGRPRIGGPTTEGLRSNV